MNAATVVCGSCADGAHVCDGGSGWTCTCEVCRLTPTAWRVGDAGHTVFGPPNGNPAPEVIATVRKPAHARTIARAVNAVTSKTGVLAQLKAAVDLLGAMPVSDKDRGIIEAHVRQYRAAIAEVEARP